MNFPSEWSKTLREDWLLKTYSKVRIGRSLCDLFPIQNSLKQEDTL